MRRLNAVEGTKVSHDVKTVILAAIGLTAILSGCWKANSSDVTGTYDLKAIAIDPVTPTTLYVGTNGGGVYKSTDGGGSWARANNGLFDLRVTALAIDWVTPSYVYVGTADGGIFSSPDYGETWAPPVGQSPITDIRGIVIDRIRCLPDIPPPCRDIYLGSQASGMWKSTDSGHTFSQINENLTNPAVTAVAIFPTLILYPTTRLYIGTEGGGLFRRGTTETQWTEADPGLKALTQEEVVSLAVNPQLNSELYVGTSGGEAISGGSGIYKSTDSGSNFTRVYNPIYNYTIFFMVPVIGPSATDLTLYAGADGIIKSTDHGSPSSWSRLPPDSLTPGLTAFAVAEVTSIDIDHSTFYAALFNRKLIKTTDGGQTWTTLSLQ